jgi:endoribonuclease Dicer
VPSCNLIIRFDPSATVRSFIQSRGRARKQNSDYVLLVRRHVFQFFCLLLFPQKIFILSAIWNLIPFFWVQSRQLDLFLKKEWTTRRYPLKSLFTNWIASWDAAPVVGCMICWCRYYNSCLNISWIMHPNSLISAVKF